MSSNDSPDWPARLLRAGSLLALAVAVVAWLAPTSVPGKNLQPFGCGSPATPSKGSLAKAICGDDLTGARYVALALLVVAALLLVASELVAPRLGSHRAFRGLSVVLPFVLPIAAVSVAALFIPVGTEGADGALIRCGTPLDPERDPFVRGTCGYLPERQKVLAFGGLGLSLLVAVSGAYVASGGSRRTHEGDSGVDTQNTPGDNEVDFESSPGESPVRDPDLDHYETRGNRK